MGAANAEQRIANLAAVGMTGRSFEDFTVGERFVGPGVTVTEADIIDFAFRYDPQPFHIDTQAAAASPFGGLIASGFHTMALTFRMFWQTGALAGCAIGSPGIDAVRWLKPVRPGDTLVGSGEVLEARPSGSDLARGIIRMRFAAANQHGETVITYDATIFIRRRAD